MAGADVLLTVGIARTASYQTIDTDLQAIQKHIEGKKLKINVGINTAVKTAWSQQIKSILNGINEKGLTVKVKKVDIGAGAISSFKRQLESVVNTIRLDKGVSLTLKAKDIGEIKKDFDDAGTAADEAARKIGAFKAQMEAFGSLKKEVQAALKSLGSGGTEEERARIAEINAQYEKWNEEILTVKASGTAASAERREALQAEHDAILKNISAIVEERKAQEQSASAATTAMQQLVSQRQQVQAALGTLGTGESQEQQNRIAEIIAQYEELEAKIKQIEASDISASEAEIANLRERYSAILRMISAYKEEESAKRKAESEETRRQSLLKQSASLMIQMQNAERNWTKARNGVSSADYAAIHTYIKSLEELRGKLANGQISNEQFASSFKTLQTQFTQTAGAIKSVGENTGTAMSRIGSLSEKFATWFSITRVIMYAVRAIKDMAKASIELDSAFTQLKIVTGATDVEMSKFVDTTVALAKNLGQSITDVTKAIETFSRLGYNLPDASKLAEFATIMANVASVSIDEATTGMTSIIKGFNMNVSDTEHVADVLVEVGQKYAVSAAEMMEAFEKSGAALHATNTSFEKSAGLIAAANASVQNASTVGTALKTVSARIRGSKTDLEELGEGVEDLADGFSKYAKELKAITGFDIIVEGTTNQFKDLYDIMEGISGVWDKLSDTQQARVAEILGGTRQLQVISSIIGNWDDAVDAYATSMNAAGAATRANSIYMDSVQAKINQFKASFQELSMTLMQSDFLADMVEIGKGLVELLNKVSKFVNLIGGVKVIIAGIVTAIIAAKIPVVISWFSKIIAGVKTLVAVLPIMKTGVLSNAAALEAMGVSAESAHAAITLLKGGLVVLAMLAVASISKIKQGVQEAAEAEQALIEKSKQSIPTNTQRLKLLSDLRDEYLNIVDSENSEEKKVEELNRWKKELIETYGLEEDAIDKVNTKRETGIELLDKEATRQADAAWAEASKAYYEAQSVYENGFTPDIIDTSGGREVFNSPEYQEYIDAAKKFGFDISMGYRDGLIGGNSGDSFVELLLGEGTIEDQYNRVSEAISKLTEQRDSWNQYHTEDNDFETAFPYESWLLNVLQGIIGDLGEKYRDASDTIASGSRLLAQSIWYDEDIPNKTIETKEAYEDLIETLTEKYSDRGDGVVDELLRMVNDAFPAFAKGTSEIKGNTESSAVSFSELADKVKSVKDAYDLLATAEKEMKDGGLSADTIKALADETSDYLDYLYEENGVIKLNTQAWKDYILTKLTDSTKENDGFSGLNELQATRAALIAEREEIQRNREEFHKRFEDGDVSTYLYNAIAAEDEKLAENTRLLAENGIQIGIITEQYNQAAMFVDAYSAALDGFTDVADTISSVSDALTVVADLQDAVADGFTMSLEKALEFAKVYPEILDNASVAADGQIELNKATVNSFIDGKQAEIKADIDSRISELQTRRNVLEAQLAFARAELELAQSVGEGKGQITQEEAEYRVNAGNAAAQALIAAGIDEANAYRLACAAMAQNAQEFDRIAMNVCTDVDGNFNKAAYEAAQGIYRNMNSAKQDISSVAMQAQLAASAIAGMAAGIVAGSSAIQAGSSGGSNSNSYSMNMTAGTFNGTNYSYTPQTVSLEKFISDLELDISSYENAISQIDGQIAALQALRNKDLKSYKSSDKTGGSGKTGSGKSGSGKSDSSSSSTNGPTWFEQQYKLHNHLLNMDAEKVEDYLVWLNDAFQKAYKQNIITLDDFYKYQEEVYTKSREVFKDYLNDVEHQIYLEEQKSAQSRDISKIIDYYRELMSAVSKESQRARKAGLTEEDDYIQELQKKYREYYDAIADARSKWFNELLEDEKFSIERMNDVGADSNKVVNAWKGIIESIRKELSWYLENGYKMTDDVVQDLIKDLWAARDEIVSIANSVVDGIQNVYKTFTDAATEWATTGYLSVDSFQSILELGPKYLKFLYDENGQLRVNEKSLQAVLAAKTEELAIDNAMTYAKQVLAAAQNKDIDTLIALTQVNSSAAASSWDLVFATIAMARAIGAANKMESKYFDDALDYITKIRSLSETTISTIAGYYDTLNEGYISQSDALDKLIDYTKQLVKWENEQQVQALRDQIDAYKEIVDAKKESLKLSKEQDEHDKTVAEKLAEIAKLQARIDLLALDDSREAKAERAKLEEELAEKQKELADQQGDYAYDKQVEALDKSLEEFENEKNAEIETVTSLIDSEEKLYQAAIDRIQNGWDTLYDQLIVWNTQYGSDLNKNITSAWNSAADAVSRYGSFLDALIGTDSHVDIGPYIDEYGNSNNTGSGEGVLAKMRQNSVNWWGATDEERSSLHKQSMALADQYQKLTGKSLKYDKGTWYTEDGQRAFTRVTKDEITQVIVAAMKRNSNAWGQADKETRQYLSDANLVLGARLAKILNANVYREHGVWYIGNRRLFDVYHSGGIAGNKPTLKQNEVMAVLEKGEAVLDANREKELYKVIDFVQVLSDRLGKAINPVGLSAMVGSIRGLPTITPAPVATDGSGSFVFSPSIQVTISHNGAMSDFDARRYGNEIAETALEKLSDAFARRGINNIGNSMLKQ